MSKFINRKNIIVLLLSIVVTTVIFSCFNINKTTSLLSFVFKSEENENTDSTELETLNVSGFKSQYTFDPKVNSYNIEIFDNTYFLNIRAVPKSENANVEIIDNDYFGTSSGTVKVKVTNNNKENTYLINWTKVSQPDVAIIEEFSYKGSVQEYTVPYYGRYKIELWGASSGDKTNCTWGGCSGATNFRGLGAYTAGDILLKKEDKLYIYVGQVGYTSFNNNKVAFNGGASFPDAYSDGNNFGGGGATDVRLVKASANSWYDTSHSSWNSDRSLLSRIMVAGGGGGVVLPVYTPGHAGGLTSFAASGASTVSSYPTQTSGPQLGIGQSGSRGAAGGGYYGGYATTYAGNGGSSYISGHTGAVAVENATSNTPKDGCTTGTTDKDCSIHYSELYFTDTVMVDGAGYSWTNVKGSKTQQTQPDGTLADGHSGNGYARITYLSNFSNYNYLDSITFDNGSLSTELSKNKTEYTINLDSYAHSLTVTSATSNNGAATISGIKTYSNLPLNPEPIYVSVTGESGDTRVYTFRFVRNSIGEHSSKIYNIKSILNSETIECLRGVYSYPVTVYSHQLYLDFDIELYDSEANYEIKDNFFENESGTITIVVSAPDVSDSTYYLSYTKIQQPIESTDFDYTGDIQSFTAPYSGYYKLEVWGAQGGTVKPYSGATVYIGGYGGYSRGVVYLEKDETVYVVVGGQGSYQQGCSSSSSVAGGYNGGGASGWGDCYGGISESTTSGGGATHISKASDLLKNLSEAKGAYNETTQTYDSNDILIVAGGGGGSEYYNNGNQYVSRGNGGHGGGYKGSASTDIYRAGGGSAYYAYGGTQTAGGTGSTTGSFGQGGQTLNNASISGGGGGFFGGASGSFGAGGGSGYIGSPKLVSIRKVEKAMYCYNCTSEENNEHIKTYTNTNVSSSPIEEYSKMGNGYARITSIGVPSNNNFLSKLNSNTGYFDKDFKSSISEYTLYVDLYTHSVELSGNLSDANFASVEGFGEYQLSVKTEPVIITVTAENGAVRTYTINIQRIGMVNGHSSKLFQVNNETNDQVINCEKDIYTYDGLYVFTHQISIDIVPVPFDEDATWEIRGNGLILNDGTVTITVHAPGVADSVYYLNFTRIDYKDIAQYEFEFNYTGTIQTFTPEIRGLYKLEVWGAQGGHYNDANFGGYGGYSTGSAYLRKGETVYVVVGGNGSIYRKTYVYSGGYNGGGGTHSSDHYVGTGGGATHIARSTGLLKELVNKKDDVLIVAGGGGGSYYESSNIRGAGGSGGGYIGGDSSYTITSRSYKVVATGGTQYAGGNCGKYYNSSWPGLVSPTSDGSFGQGGQFANTGDDRNIPGGGGGWYGGAATVQGSGSAGSGYIASKELVSNGDLEKHMTCFNCPTSNEENTKTISNGCANNSPISDCGKSGSGYAKITYYPISANNYLKSLTSDTGTWETEFDPVTQNYQINASLYTQSITIDGEVHDSTATASGFGEYFLEIGYNYITIEVTAQSGDIRTYNITVLRENLKGKHSAELMKIINTKNEETIRCVYQKYDYDLIVYSYQTSIDLDIVPYDSEATWTISGNQLILEDGVITIEVSAPGGLSTTYYLSFERIEVPNEPLDYNYTGSPQEFIAPYSAIYNIELWGAQGGTSLDTGSLSGSYSRVGGYGGYSKGSIALNRGDKFYVYVGGRGTNAINGGDASGGWNGGGSGTWDHEDDESAGAGGGSTDFRIIKGEWNESKSLASRLIVAAGGGGAAYNQAGGYAGGLIGGQAYYGGIANQSSGYAFGYGGPGIFQNSNVEVAGGGGGYYGGIARSSGQSNVYRAAGGGGSSYISGHTGSVAIKSETNTSPKLDSEENVCITGSSDIECSIHYSGLVFEDTVMVDGEGYNWTTTRGERTGMPSISGGTEYGHQGNGYARISYEELLSDNNYLRYIETSADEMVPVFDTLTFDYTINVDAYTYEIFVEAEAYEQRAKVNGTGKHHLSLGENEIPLTVTAPDGSLRIYNITVIRNGLGYPSSELMQYNIDNVIYEVGQGETEFDINILSGVYSLNIEGIPFDSDATVTYSGFGYIKTSKTAYIIVDNPKANPKQTVYKFNIVKGDLSGSEEFDYTGTVQVFDVEYTGYYQIEAWGAQGGNANGYAGGYGGYSTGIAHLRQGEQVYVYVGGQGKSNVSQQIVYSDYNWTWCAGEGGTCNAPAGALIAYGERSTFVYRQLGDTQTSISCSNSVFGDPLSGVVKKCMYTTEPIKSNSGDNTGGFNGGGNANPSTTYAGAGGGATHVSAEPGLLKDLSNKKGEYSEETKTYNSEDILIVAGGGGGAGYSGTRAGGSGGGYLANYQSTSGTGYGASQISGGNGEYAGEFGLGGSKKSSAGGAGGGGFFGGGASYGDYGAGGGSGFIGSSRLQSIKTLPKHMTCYNCATSEDSEIYTETTTRYSSNPTTDYAKAGNGYVKITVLNLSENRYLSFIDVKNIVDIDNPTDLTLNEEFDMKNLDYTITVDPNVTNIRLSAKPEDSKATIEGIGDFDVSVGTTTYPIIVTAENGDFYTYTVTVTREADTNNKPNDIVITGLVKSLCSTNEIYCKLYNDGNVTNFDTNKNEYTLTVPSRIKQLKWNVDKGNVNQLVIGDGVSQLSSGTTRVTIEIESEYCAHYYPELNAVPEEGHEEEFTPVDKNDPKYAICFSTYTYDVTRIVSDDADLDKLFIDNINTTGDFDDIPEEEKSLTFDLNYTDPDVFDYFFSVPNSWDHVKYLVAVADAASDGATVEITGNENFVVGESNLVTIKVTAPDRATIRNYRLHVYRELNQNVYINNLNTGDFALTPTFSKYNFGDYTITVPNNYDSITLTFDVDVSTTSAQFTRIRSTSINESRSGNTYTVTISNIPTGNTYYELNTTAENDTYKGKYTFIINRIKNADSRLSSLVAKNGEDTLSLSPEFDKDTYNYEVNLLPGVTSITLEPTVNVDTSSYRLLDNNNINVGNNKKRILVTAEDGSYSTYTINFVRPPYNDANLLSIDIIGNDNNHYSVKTESDGDFDSEITKYNVKVPNNVYQVRINALKNNNYASVYGNGNYYLSVGLNDITLSVTAEDGTVKYYYLTIQREPNGDATLSSVVVRYNNTDYTPEKSDTTYSLTIPYNIDYVDINYSFNASTTSASFTDSSNNVIRNNNVPLVTGENIYKIITKAEDSTEIIYTVNLEREISTVNTIDSISIKEGRLKKTSDNDYTAKLPFDIIEVNFIVKLSDDASSYSITSNNSNIVINKDNVKNLELGDNLLYVTVIAEDGTPNIYTVTLTVLEEGSANNFLLSITTDKGELNPTFVKNTYYYEVEITYNITSIKVSAKPEEEDEVSSILGVGTYNNLSVGDNLISIVVESIDGIERVYNLNVIRQESTDSSLKDLSIRDINLNPSFNSNTLEYTINLDDSSIPFDRIIPYAIGATYEIQNNSDLDEIGNTYDVDIVVTAPNGVNTTTYTIHAKRVVSSNAYLDSLSVTDYTISPTFEPTKTTYTLTVPNNVTNVLVDAKAQNSNATVTGKGIQNLVTGENFVNVIVTAEDNTTVRKYTICITREYSSNKNIESLEILNGELKQEYSNDINSYDVDIYANEDHLEFKIILEDTASSYIVRNNNLPSSNNIVYLDINSEDGTTRLLTFNVTIKPVVSSLLKDLSVDNYWFDNDFNSNIFTYNLTINYEDDDLEFSYELLDSGATITTDASINTTTKKININNLVVGLNTLTINTIDSENNETSEYVVNIIRNPYVDNFLDYFYHDYGDGEWNEDFDKLKYIYTLDVDKDTSEITLYGSPVTSKAVVSVTTDNTLANNIVQTDKLGTFNLNKGENIFIVNVNLNGYTRKYKAIVTRAYNTDNDLLTLTVRSGRDYFDLTPEFNKNTTSYTVEVTEDLNSVTFEGTISDGASVNGLGKKSLEPGNNDFAIVVTAENGVAKTYNINVIKPASNNAKLIDIIPSSGSLTPPFGYENNTYDLILDGSVSTLYFTVVTEDANATVTGIEERLVPDGETIRVITVTAEDRETTEEYIINVSKIISNDATLIDLSVNDYLFIDINNHNSEVEFDPDNHEYYVIVQNSKRYINSSDINAITNDDAATLSYSNETFIPTSDFTDYIVTVTAEDKVTKSDYLIHFKREIGTSSRIIDVEPTKGYLEMSFDNTTNDYVWVVPKISDELFDNLGYVLEDPDATVTYAYNNEVYTVVVTSEDGSSTSTYTFTLKKEGSNSFLLESLIVKDNSGTNLPLTPEFDSEENEYVVHAYTNSRKVTITGESLSEILTVSIYNDLNPTDIEISEGTFTLNNDEENFTVSLLDEDKSVNDYHIKVIKDTLTDKNLTNLYLIDEDNVCEGSMCKIKPNFKPLIANYKVDVPNSYNKLNIGYETTNEQQTVKFKYNEKNVENGESLVPGNNVISVEVYDGVGALTRTYYLTINRTKSGNANLASLNVSSIESTGYTLSPEFDPNTLEYDIEVSPEINEVEINVTTEDSEATKIINGYNNLQPGENDVTITVLAADRKTEKTYIVHVFVGDPTKQSFLTGISVSSGKIFDLNPNFKKSTTAYVVTTESSTESVMIEATYDNTKNIRVDGEGEYNVFTGVNVFTLTSTLYEDDNETVISTTVYTISVIRPISSNVYLADMKVTSNEETELLNNDGFYNLSKPFDKGTTEYGLTVSPGVSTLDIRYRLEDENSRVVIYGNRLVTGINYVDVVVFNEDETLTKTYQITVNVLPSEDSTLSKIKVYNTYQDEFENDLEEVYGISDEEFNASVDNTYSIRVPYNIEKVIIEGTATKSSSVITGNGTYYLEYGNNELVLYVEAEDGIHTSTYTVNVYREYDLFLSDIKVDENSIDEFDKTNDTYELTVTNDVKKLTIEGIPEEENVSVSYSIDSGSSELATITEEGILYTGVGINKVVITVTASDNTFKNYYVNIMREQSDNNYLEYLEFDEGIFREPFEKTKQEYSMYILDTYTSLDLSKAEIIPEDSTATYAVSGYAGLSKVAPNTVTVAVTSESGKVRNYTIEVILKPESFFMHYLKSLKLSYKVQNGETQETVESTLSPIFAQNIRNYTVTVPYSVSSITANAIPLNDDDDAILSASTEPGESLGDATYPLNFGRNVISIRVTSRLSNSDGSFGMYKVIVYRSMNATATLQNLAVENHPLSPSFNTNRTSYTIDIDSSEEKLNITAIPTDPGATVEIIGNGNFKEGNNTITIKVTAADNKTTKNYYIIANCTLSDNNYLSKLEIKDYLINPVFNKTNTGVYTTNVDEDVTSVYLTALPEDSSAKMSIMTASSTYDKNNISLKLNPGNNYVYISVTSAAGNIRTYTLNIFRSYSTDNYLKELVVSDGILVPDFESEGLVYNVTLDGDLALLNTVTVIGIKNHPKATVIGNGEYTLNETGTTTVKIKVKAQSGDEREYTVNFIKKEAPSSKLKLLKVYEGELNPEFSNDGYKYYLTVPYEVTSLDLTLGENVIPEDSDATVTITGNEDFKVGINIVTIKVTATNGDTKTYLIYVTRSILASNYLSDLYVEDYQIEPEFNSDNLYYSLTVGSNVESVHVYAEKEEPQSTLEINGSVNNDKVINLDYGENKVYFTVTSENGASRTYTLVVTRSDSDEYYLLTLSTNLGTWNKEFNKDTNDYVIDVPAKTNMIVFSGTSSVGSTVEGLDSVQIKNGENNHMIVVTSPSGLKNTYNFTINRPSSNNANALITSNQGDLTLENDIYKLSVDDSISQIKFIVTPEDSDAKVVMNDSYELNYGKNEITIKVIAEDGVTEKDYYIEIYRKKDIESISYIDEEVIINVGVNVTPEYVINPEDTDYKDVTFKSDDETIAIVDANGEIKGIGNGITYVYVISKHNSKVFDWIKVNVASTKITSNVYNIWRVGDSENDLANVDFSYVIGANDKTSVDDFFINFDNNVEYLKVYSNGELVTNQTSFVGTGMIIKLVINDHVYDELVIIVRGDNGTVEKPGNGIITSTDYATLSSLLAGLTLKTPMTSLLYDLNKNKILTVTDLSPLSLYIAGKATFTNLNGL